MPKYFSHHPFIIVCAAVWMLFANVSWAAEYRHYQLANGMAIYFGILPAEMTMGRLPDSVHGGAPTWGEQYHVFVSIFDNTNGNRITDAEVSATVFNAKLPGRRVSGPQKRLKPMQVAGGASYGGYFNMPGTAPYRIELEIRQRGAPEAIRAAFDYMHAVVPHETPF